MKLSESFRIEPIIKRQFPDQPYAPAWCSMWLEQHQIETPTNEQVRDAMKAYAKKVRQ